MNYIQKWQIKDDFELLSLSKEDFIPLFIANRNKVFQNTLECSSNDLQIFNTNKSWDLFGCYLMLFRNNEVVGWSFGTETTVGSFCQINSGVLPNFRNKGLYTEILKIMVEVVVKNGFTYIYSRHNMTNSAIIVPKLKFGFVITGVELSENMGTLVRLSYTPNQLVKEMLDFRCGQSKPNDKIKTILDI